MTTAILADTDILVRPTLPDGPAAAIMGLQRRFDETQWWPADRLRALQFQKLLILANHAARNVPYYTRALRDAGFVRGQPIDEKTWQRVPILTRAELRKRGESLAAKKIPAGFGTTALVHSSGSTGIPVGVRKSTMDQLIWSAAHVREERWHCEDVGGIFAAMKAFSGVKFSPEDAAALRSKDGLIRPNWGAPSNLVWRTGKSSLIHGQVPIADRAQFLINLQPNYLLTSPSSLRLLLTYFRDQNLSLPSLQSVRTASERLDDDLREFCQDIFKCRIVHNYTANEVGYIALQCPESTKFHIQSETILCEVLDPTGRACQPGEIGKVVVTPLHNFSMPLLRYEIGDEAMVGGPCTCGRGLHVLDNIVGRLSDYLILKSGERRRVTYNTYKLSSIKAIIEYQIIQKTLDSLELSMVVNRPLADDEVKTVMEVMTPAFGAEFAINLTFRASLPRTAAGKLRPFLSEVKES